MPPGAAWSHCPGPEGRHGDALASPVCVGVRMAEHPRDTLVTILMIVLVIVLLHGVL